MKKSSLLLSLLALMIYGSGCQNTVNTVEDKQKYMVPDNVQTKYVSTDRFCRDRLVVKSINKATLPTGLLMIQLTVYSDRVGVWQEFWSWYTANNPYKVEYKIDWLDTNGMQVNTTNSIWIEMTIIPGETKRIQAVAPNERCKDFVISLKEYGKGTL